MGQYDDFESIRDLDSEAQRSLLIDGDFVERIWAAWALALKYGKDIVPELLVCLQNSPVPGTRRHLIVVLAGLGQFEKLCALAQNDPDEYVRATACRYLIKTRQAGDKHTSGLLRSKALHDPSAVVRLAILQEVGTAFPLLDRKDLEHLSRDSDPEVRYQAETLKSSTGMG